jgi:hypothetical protein
MSNPFSTTIGKENGINLLNAHIQWHFGTIAPVTTYPFQNWGDTANDLWKQRNVADTDWIIRGTLSAAYFGLTTADLVDPLGTAKEYYGSTLPTKHLWVNGNTIGDASSNATGRANADTEALFTVLWGSVDNTNSQIKLYDSAGVLSTKGASATVDFAAHKKISLPDRRDNFARGLPASGRIIGSYQEDAFQGHWHETLFNELDIGVNAGASQGYIRHQDSATDKTDSTYGVHNAKSDGINGTPKTANETRPKNVACNFIMRY